MKEAAARIKINKLLEASGWRFFADGNSQMRASTVSLAPAGEAGIARH
jgi:hypothetical protein